ncbi:HAD-IA family hydrolase [Candidatus Dojkabacteria bacterium]|nr:HAD-IA family hydrolase [Candidatus Dojkabacteria bacterium]
MQNKKPSLKNFDTIIFDMDGVVIDSGPLWKEVNVDFFGQFGVKFIDYGKILTKLNGKSPADAMKVFQNEYNIPGDSEELARERSTKLVEIVKARLKYIKGFEDFVQRLIVQEKKIAIATGADYYLLDNIKAILNLEDYFGEHIYSVEDVNFISKPDPATFLLAAEKLKSKPGECIVIEDGILGIQAANTAGMYSIGFRNGEKTKFEEADLTVEDYQDLKKLL